MKKLHAITIFLGIVIITVLATACTAGKTPENITVTFSADMQCSVDGPKSLRHGENTIDMVGKSKDHGKIGLAVGTLDAGKTVKDLQDLPTTVKPLWMTMIIFFESPSDGTIYPQTLTIPSEIAAGPIYFVCFSEIPEKKIGALGPFEVKD